MPRRSVSERVHAAAAAGDLKILTRLATNQGLVSNIDPQTGRSNIVVAAEAGQTEACVWLWQHSDSANSDARLSSRDPSCPGGTIVHLATLGDHDETLATILEHFPQLVNFPNDEGQSPLHIAARAGNLAALQILLHPDRSPAADLDLPDNRGDTPLHVASAWGRHSLLAPLILTYKASYTTKNLAGFSPGEIAYDRHTAEAVKNLIHSKSDDDKRVKKNRVSLSALKMAVTGDHRK